MAVVCVPALCFQQEPPADVKSSPSAPALVQLSIHDLSLEVTEPSAYYQALQKAIPDTLYLHFLEQPRLQVSRDPTVFQSKADFSRQVTATAGDGGQSRDSTYLLVGKITPVEVHLQNVPESQLSGHHLFILQFQILEQVGREADPKLKLRPISVATTTSELLDTLNQVTQQVVETLVPVQKLALSVASVRVDGFPARTQRFYESNLLSLLRSSLLESGLIQLTDNPEAAAYKLNETARVHDDVCEVSTNLKRPDGTVIDIPLEKGPTAQILETHTRATEELIDALRIENSSPLSRDATSSSRLTAGEYVEAANRYQRIDPELALALYRKALTLDASDRTARQSLASSLLTLDRPKEVLDLLKNPADSRDRLLRAIAYRGLKDNKRTVEELNAGMIPPPDDTQYYAQAATIFEDLGDYEAAAAALETGRRTTNDTKLESPSEVRRRGAAALIHNGKPDQALPLALDSLREEPLSEWGLRLAGIAYIRTGEAIKGEEYLIKALNIKPTAYAATELGRLRLTEKKYDDARAFGQQAIRLDPQYEAGYYILVSEINDRAESEPAQVSLAAREVVGWLKHFWQENPSARTSVIALTAVQMLYVGTSAREIHELYEIHNQALQGVTCAAWQPGCLNLVEIAMLDGRFDEASKRATELLKIDLRPGYRVNMAFYSWMADLLLGDCEKFRTDFSAFAEYVQRPELQGLQNPWFFEGTKRFLDARSQEGAINSQASNLINSALALLESKPFTKEAIQKFETDSSRLVDRACGRHQGVLNLFDPLHKTFPLLGVVEEKVHPERIVASP